MILYHGSSIIVDKSLVSKSRDSVDFGMGFYTTDIKSQAIRWTERLTILGKKGYVSKYEIDNSVFKNPNIKVKNFENYDREWLRYVVACRKKEEVPFYDIIIGSMANDRVYNAIELYMSDLISEEEALKRLSFPIENRQICFRNQEVIDKYLVYKGCDEYVSR